MPCCNSTDANILNPKIMEAIGVLEYTPESRILKSNLDERFCIRKFVAFSLFEWDNYR